MREYTAPRGSGGYLNSFDPACELAGTNVSGGPVGYVASGGDQSLLDAKVDNMHGVPVQRCFGVFSLGGVPTARHLATALPSECEAPNIFTSARQSFGYAPSNSLGR